MKWLSKLHWKHEPVLWLAAAISVINTVNAVLNHSVDLGTGVNAVVAIVGGFLVRGNVVPVSHVDWVEDASK